MSSGTYVRSLAHEIGRGLGVGAHLASLCRTRSGNFTLANAYTLEQLAQLADRGRLQEALLPPRQLLPELPAVVATVEQAARVRHGNTVNLAEFTSAPMVRVFDQEWQLLAVAQRLAGTLFHPRVVLG